MFLTSNCGKLWFLCNSSKNLPGKLDRNKCIVFAFIKAHRRKRQAYADNREHTVFEISDIFTIRKRSCGKEMFSQACVKKSVHGVGGCLLPGGVSAPWGDVCSGGVCSRGGLLPGGLVPGVGVWSWGGLPQCMLGYLAPPVNRITHASENITLPKLRCGRW